MAKASYKPLELEARMRNDKAGLHGVLTRVVAVLNIPWQSDPELAPYQCMMKGLDKWLTEKQFPETKTEEKEIEVPFG